MSTIADFEVAGEASLDPDRLIEDVSSIIDKFDELSDKIDELDAKMDELSRKDISIEVVIDGQDKLDELMLFLDDLDSRVYTVRIAVDIQNKDELDALYLDILELELTDHTVDVKVEVDGLDEAELKLAAFNKTVDDTSKKLDSASKSGSGFEFSLLMLAPLLIPASAAVLSLVGAVGGLASAFGTMLPAVGLAAYGTEQLYTSVSTLYTGLSATTQAALMNADSYAKMYSILDKNSTAFQRMSSLLQETVVRYAELKQEVSQFQEAIDPAAEWLLINVFQLLTTSLSMLIDPATEAAKAIAGLLENFTSRLSDPTFQTFFDNMDKNIGTLVDDWGGGVENIIEGIVALLNAFMPLSMDMSGGFLKMTASFDTWAQHLAESDGFKKFVATVETDGPIILNILGQLVLLIAHLVGSMGESSGNAGFLKFLDDMLKALNGFMGTHQGLTTTVADLTLMGAAAAKLGPALVPLMSFLMTPVGAVVGAIVALGVAFVVAYEKSSQFRSWVQANLFPMFKQLEGYVQQFKQWFTSVWPDIQKVWEMYGKNIENIIVADFQFIVSTIGNAMKVIEGIIDIVLGLLTGNWSKVWTGIKLLFGALVGEIIAFAKAFGTDLLNVLEMAWKMIFSDTSSAWEDIRKNFDTNLNNIKNDLTGAWNTAVSDTLSFGSRMVSAVKNTMVAVLVWFVGLPGDIKNAVGSLASVLWNAGVSVIVGLINGISSEMGNLESYLGDITSWITDWKGPPEKDRNLLYDAGASIIGSLMDGMESKYVAVANSLGGLTKNVANTFGSQFSADITGKLDASLNSKINSTALGSGGNLSGGVAQNVSFGAVTINNPAAETGSQSLTKMLQSTAAFGIVQAPQGATFPGGS